MQNQQKRSLQDWKTTDPDFNFERAYLRSDGDVFMIVVHSSPLVVKYKLSGIEKQISDKNARFRIKVRKFGQKKQTVLLSLSNLDFWSNMSEAQLAIEGIREREGFTKISSEETVEALNRTLDAKRENSEAAQETSAL